MPREANVRLVPLHERETGAAASVRRPGRDREPASGRASDGPDGLYHDTLTGLPDASLLADRLQQAMVGARRTGERVGVLLVDLDGFAEINWRLGFARGDKVLQAVAKRLVWTLRSTDTVARLGGDEFALVLPGLKQPRDAAIAAEHVLAGFDEALRIEGRSVPVTPSIGIALWPDDAQDVDPLLQSAARALRVAKTLGGGEAYFHSSKARDAEDRRRQLADAMRRALRKDEFRLHYQPIVDSSGGVSAVEALLRWERPEEARLYPAQFLAIAEETRMIVPLGEWAIREACRQIRSWRDGGHPPIPVTVNASPYQLTSPMFVHTVLTSLEDHELSPDDLRIELAEAAIEVNRSGVLATLVDLQAAGVPVGLDDFGTGDLSPARLGELPVDTVKIAPAFVHELGRGTRPDQRVRGMIELAHGMGKRVVAEGVETTEQLERLTAYDCDAIQGHAVSAPVTALRLPDLLSGPLLRCPDPA